MNLSRVLAPQASLPTLRGALFVVASLIACGIGPASANDAGSPVARGTSESYGTLPLRFEPNHGQTDTQVRFMARGPGYTLFLTPQETVIHLGRAGTGAHTVGSLAQPNAASPGPEAVVRLSFEGASPAARMEGQTRMAGVSNYLMGGRTLRDIPQFASVRAFSLYPGVDAVYYGKQNQLEYDLVVAPGADPAPIALAIDGAQRLQLDAQGDLLISTPAGQMVQHAPVAYQLVDGKRQIVQARYALRGKTRAGLVLGAYDRTRELVIDPVLVYSTYLGGTLGDRGMDVAVDTSKNAYVTGYTGSAAFPTKGAYQAVNKGAFDVFVAKLSPTGTLLYSTYLGGAGADEANNIAVDAAGAAYVTGRTTSIDFPTVSAFQTQLGGTQDAFVFKLNAAGNGLVYSTFLGGNANTTSSTATGEFGYGIAVDSAGSAYVTGWTASTNFPTVNPIQANRSAPPAGCDPAVDSNKCARDEIFVSKLAANGASLIYSTYLGGTEYDEAYGLALDSSNAVYITGTTLSSNFPTASPKQGASGSNGDAFVAKISAAGNSLVYSTYLGGFGQDLGYGIAVDASGSAYVAGVTSSSNFPSVGAAQAFNAGLGGANADGFVTKVSPSGNAWTYSTWVGGSLADSCNGIVVDASGNAYVAGQTSSTAGFPLTGAIQSTQGGASDAFLVKLSSSGSAFAYGTYLGGSADDYGNDVDVDSGGDAYIIGYTGSANFPVLNAAQATNAGSQDAFISRVSSANDATLSINDVRMSEGDAGTSNMTFTVSLSKTVANPVSFSIASSNNTATSGSDYVALSLTGQSIAAGSTSKTFSVVINGDSAVEPDETFFMNLSAVSGALIGDGQGVGTIVNDDVPSLSIADVSLSEGNSGTSNMTFTVSLSGASANNTTFDLATANGTAVAPGDYVAKTSTGVSIPAGSTSATFTVVINGDTTTEPDETFTVNLTNASGANVSDAQAVGTIKNDDTAPLPTLSVDDVRMNEGNAGTSNMTFTVSLSAAAPTDVSFNAFTSNNTASSGTDFVGLNLTGQVIPAGSSSKTFNVVINGDTALEQDETFFFNVSSVSGGATLSDGQGIGTILNDDVAVLPTLSVGDVQVNEGNSGTSMATFTVQMSAVSGSTVSFDVATSNGTATAGSDYVAMALAGQTLTAGQTSKTFSVTVNGDTAVEPNETFNFTVSNPSGATIADGQAIGTILNDDSAATPTLSIGDVSITEGNSGTSLATFTVSLSSASANTVGFTVATADGTALAGSDYVALVASSQSIPAGQTSKTISVAINGDTSVEVDEFFTVNLTNPSNATIGDSQAIGTIINDDTVVVIPSISVNDASVAEGDNGNKSLSFTVSLSVPTTVPVSFDIFTSNGTAAPGIDYTEKSLTGQTIPAGQTSYAFSVALLPDTIVENNETFTVNLNNVSGATVADSQGLGKIINDDDSVLSVSDVSVAEGDSGSSGVEFFVTLAHPMPTPVTFNFATSNGTATAGSDYTARTGSGFIDAGRTTTRLYVNITGDTAVESDETFRLTISNAVGAMIGTSFGTATITNDDAAAVVISQIQTAQAVSPLEGDTVQTKGVVSGIGENGFYLQSTNADMDSDPATSEGLYVAQAAPQVSVGDLVSVKGVVRELDSDDVAPALTTTTLVAERVAIVEHGQTLPAAISLTAANAGANLEVGGLERYESMRVLLPKIRVVGPAEGRLNARTGSAEVQGAFYAVMDGVGRPFAETQVSSANSERFLIQALAQRGGGKIAADVGDTVAQVPGVLGHAQGVYTVMVDGSKSLSQSSGATEHTVATRAGLGIGSMNLRDLLNDQADTTQPVLNANAYATRLAKTANAVCHYANTPAIMGVFEVENQATLNDLAGAINGKDGNTLFPGQCKNNTSYKAYVPAKGENISVGLLVDTSRAQVQSAQAMPSPQFALKNGKREALFAQAPVMAQVKLNDGKMLQVLVVKMSETEGDLTQASSGWSRRGDYLRAKQVLQRRFLINTVKAWQTSHPGQALVMIGGLDAPEAKALAAGTALSNTAAMLSAPQRYTVVRMGQAIMADPILVNDAAKAWGIDRLEVARLNADFGDDYWGDASEPWRVSDHDPSVLYFKAP